MRPSRSLRVRLMVLILSPLIVIACVLGYWRYAAALQTAETLFDRSLLAAALAIARDVSVSEGDALSVTTRDLITEASGGQVLYHVEGPDRAYVTGYAYPPLPPPGPAIPASSPEYFTSMHRGEEVAALRLREAFQADGLQGISTVTVWQSKAGRTAFAHSLALKSAVLLGGLVATVALVIWFGVNRGLRPLTDLESAIRARTPDDLGHIRRAVPQEVQGIVSTLNTLLAQVRDAIKARDVFISNAAHQLRNPVAGMLALAEATETATTDEERRGRLAELKAAAERTARLTTQMLALERIKGTGAEHREQVDLNALAREVALRNADRILSAGIEFDFSGASQPCPVLADRLMLEEAMENLIDNALQHGGPGLGRIAIEVAHNGAATSLAVADDGRGLSPSDAPQAMERFSQVHPSSGSGLGLAIVGEVAAMHGAEVRVGDVESGGRISLRFPV